MKKVKITIPTDFTIDHYTKLGQLEHLREVEKVIRIISTISDYNEEEVKRWDLKSINKIYNDIKTIFDTVEPIFLPVFTWKGIQYGIQPLSKMNADEYIDLEKRLETADILEFMAIIYRPIVSHKFDSKWEQIKSGIKYIAGKSDDIFRYYTVEEYDNEKRNWRVDIFRDLPVSIALGAYNFFLLLALQLSNNTIQSLEGITKEEKKKMQIQMDQLYKNISGGFILSTDLVKMEDYSGSQEQKI
jgi:hypothetical protein